MENTAVGGGLESENLAALRDLYREGMRSSAGAVWVVDKANLNFERLGLAMRLFPEARAMWILRHPLDTILSCYFQDFQHGLAFTHSLDQLARMYHGHWRLMRKWTNCFGKSIQLVRYQDLVGEPDRSMQRACKFLGLEFQQAMLEPQRQYAPVRTASTLQVQQPIHTQSLGRWHHYRDQLSGVFAYLLRHNIIDGAGDMASPEG